MDKDIFNTGKNIMLVFAPDASGDQDRVVVERGAHRGSGEFYSQIGEVIASRSGLPFPEAVASLDGGSAKVRIPLPAFGNGASCRSDNARNILALAAKALLRAAITDGVSVAAVTADGLREFTAEAVPAVASSEAQNEMIGPDIAPNVRTDKLRENF